MKKWVLALTIALALAGVGIVVMFSIYPPARPSRPPQPSTSFTLVTYTGLDTNASSDIACYTCNDEAMVAQIWAALDIPSWQEATDDTTATVDIALTFMPAENGGLQVKIFPDHVAWYNDKIYTMPKTVYDQVAQLLRDYTAQFE